MTWLRKLYAKLCCHWIEYWKESKEWVCTAKWHRLDLWPPETKYTCAGWNCGDCPVKVIGNEA